MSYVGKPPIDRTLGLSQKNTGVGDGSTTNFDILTTAAPEGGDTAVDVFVDNVRQEPGTGKAYVLAADGSGDFKRITFSTAPASGAVIWTINRLRTQITNVLPGAGTINNTMLNDSVITAQSALGTTPAATDTFLVYDASASGILHLFNPASTTYVKHFYARFNVLSAPPANNTSKETNIAGYFNTTSAVNAIAFKAGVNNIDNAVIQLYGIA